MKYFELGRTYASEARFGNAQLFHVSYLKKIQETVERLETGETHFQNALTKRFSSDLRKVGISAAEFRKDLDSVFERAESISNGASIRTMRGFSTLTSHRISQKGHVYVGESGDGTVSEISLAPFMTKEETGIFTNEIMKIGAKYNLRYVDWTKPITVDLREIEEVSSYLDDIAEDPPVAEPEKEEEKKGFGYYVGMILLGTYLTSLAYQHLKRALNGENVDWQMFAFWFGLSGICYVVFKSLVQRATDTALLTRRIFPGEGLRYGDMRFITSRYDSGYHVYLTKEGKAHGERMDRAMLEGGWDGFGKIMDGMRKLRLEKQNSSNPDVAKPSMEEFSEAFKSTCLKNDQILFRDFVLNVFGKLSPYKKFLKKRYEASGFYFDGARFADWDFSEEARKENVLCADYSKLAQEKLDYLGQAKGGAYAVHMGASGKLYASRGSRLYLFGNGYEEGLYRLLLDENPLESTDYLHEKTDPLEVCSLRWHECGALDALIAMRARVMDFDKIFSKGSVVPILERGDAEEFLVYDSDTGNFFEISKEDDEDFMRAKVLEDEDQLKSYLGNRKLRSKMLCPEKFRDQYLTEICDAAGVELNEKEWVNLRNAEREGKEYESTANANGCFVTTLESNPDWKPIWCFFTENRLGRMLEFIEKWNKVIESEFGIAITNYANYMEEYGGSFGKPRATVSSIANWLGKRASNPTGEHAQYSVIIKRSVAHEAVFDICTIMGLSVDPGYLGTALDNDGLPGIHAMGIFSNPETGEFVVLDCQNIGENFCLTARTDGWQSDNVRRRMTEWENYLRSERGHRVECESVMNEIDDPGSPLYLKMRDYEITENDFMENDPEVQFAYRGSLQHKIDRFRWKWGI